jgi:sulfate permease, SulP family
MLSLLEFFLRLAIHSDVVLAKSLKSKTWDGVNTPDPALSNPGLVIYRYDTPLFFANADNFKRRAIAALEKAPSPVKYFVVDAAAIGEVDITAIEMLADLQDELTAQGVVLNLVSVKPRVLADLERAGFVDRLK